MDSCGHLLVCLSVCLLICLSVPLARVEQSSDKYLGEICVDTTESTDGPTRDTEHSAGQQVQLARQGESTDNNFHEKSVGRADLRAQRLCGTQPEVG